MWESRLLVRGSLRRHIGIAYAQLGLNSFAPAGERTTRASVGIAVAGSGRNDRDCIAGDRRFMTVQDKAAMDQPANIRQRGTARQQFRNIGRELPAVRMTFVRVATGAAVAQGGAVGRALNRPRQTFLTPLSLTGGRQGGSLYHGAATRQYSIKRIFKINTETDHRSSRLTTRPGTSPGDRPESSSSGAFLGLGGMRIAGAGVGRQQMPGAGDADPAAIDGVEARLGGRAVVGGELAVGRLGDQVRDNRPG